MTAYPLPVGAYIMENKALRAELLALCKRANIDKLPPLESDLYAKFKKDVEPYLDDSYVFGSQIAVSMIANIFPPSVTSVIESVGIIFLYVWYQKYGKDTGEETTFNNVTYTT